MFLESLSAINPICLHFIFGTSVRLKAQGGSSRSCMNLCVLQLRACGHTYHIHMYQRLAGCPPVDHDEAQL